MINVISSNILNIIMLGCVTSYISIIIALFRLIVLFHVLKVILIYTSYSFEINHDIFI